MTEVGHISQFLLAHNVNIDTQEEVPHHVINGVRFIYKQYVKKKPGVILNDPADYYQEAQVALFLNGICRGQNQHLSVLILCERDSMSTWKDCLSKWMPNFENVVAVDWAKPTSKRSVYVVIDHIESFLHREWGLVVLHADSLLDYKLPANTFKGAFKIFITADDLKEDLQKFSKIYKLLYPQQNISIEDFTPNKNSISDILQKRIWFGAFVQDVLIRNAKTFAQVSANTYRQVSKQPEPRGITRRNKDATGTKIKRTKRKLEDDNTDMSNNKIVSVHVNEVKIVMDVCDSKLDIKNDCDAHSNLDVESFIRDQEPLKMEEFNDISDIDDNISQSSEKMDVTKSKTYLEPSDSETSMKLIYSDDAVNSDDAYAMETQDNGVESDALNYKETEVFDADANILDNEVSNDDSNIDIKESDDDYLPICSEENDDSKVGISNVNGSNTENEKQSKDDTDLKEGTEKVDTKADDLESKWEEMALKKFKGSFLDRLF